MTIYEILEEINKDSSTNYKLSILEKHKDNELLKRVCQMAYDRVKFTYGISWNFYESPDIPFEYINLSDALDVLENDFATRKVTGNAAREALNNLCDLLSHEDATVLGRVIGRDLKVGVGRTQINKVWPNLITKPPYMRCGVYSEKAAQKISYPAFVQLKADGQFCYAQVENGNVTFISRSGEESFYPVLKETFLLLNDGVYVGELLVRGTKTRAESNGLLNSDNPPHDRICMQCWDYVSLEEWNRPKDKKNKTPYRERFFALMDQLGTLELKHTNIQLIDYRIVSSVNDALIQTSEWMQEGYEGSILKDYSNIFIDHTSPTQLKLKVEIAIEVRCTGFTEGTRGTKREATFGAMTFETDDGMIKGQTSGFTDAQLEDFNSRRDELIGKVFTVVCNDITIASGSSTYALSHPRFDDFRQDKDTTDTLERAFELREAALTLSK